jgi:hypothetical protein
MVLLYPLSPTGGAPNWGLSRFSKQFLRDCLIIPEKPHFGLPKEVETRSEAPYLRHSCHQS